MGSELDAIDTIVIVMMENRSFDHMLGYLSLPPFNRMDVEGLQNGEQWLRQCENIHFLNRFRPFYMADKRLPDDPPHERDFIALQVAGPSGPMRGFVSSYACIRGVDAGDQPPVMGYYTPQEVPIHHFFAQQFAVCDHWFAPLSAGTQPNRLMALSGYTLIDTNHTTLPDQYLIYDWLNDRNIRWRVYHDGFPFITLLPRWGQHVVWGWNFATSTSWRGMSKTSRIAASRRSFSWNPRIRTHHISARQKTTIRRPRLPVARSFCARSTWP